MKKMLLLFCLFLLVGCDTTLHQDYFIIEKVAKSVDYEGKYYLKFEGETDLIIYTEKLFSVGDTLYFETKSKHLKQQY